LVSSMLSRSSNAANLPTRSSMMLSMCSILHRWSLFMAF
jgi:hypothetical protein